MADFSKDTYKKALASVLGAETIVGKGPTGRAGRKLLDTAMRAFIATGRLAIPAAARTTGRAALGLGRYGARMSVPGKVGLSALALYEAQQAGLLDDPIERARRAAIDAAIYGIEELAPVMPNQTPGQMWEGLDAGKPIKRKPTKYNRAVKVGMATAKASQYFGKKGTISKPKSAFKAVNSVASRINKGKKVSAKGATGKIARAIRRILK